MKKFWICLLAFLMLTLSFSSCSNPDPSTADSLLIYNQESEKLLQNYMENKGYQQEEYRIMERFVAKDWILDACVNARSFPAITYHEDFPSYFSILLLDGDNKVKDVISCRIENGVVTEEETSLRQERMLTYALGTTEILGGDVGVALRYGHADSKINQVYCLEDTEGDGVFLHVKTDSGAYMIIPEADESTKDYFVPYYSIVKIWRSMNGGPVYIFDPEVYGYHKLIENCRMELAIYEMDYIL